MILSSWVRSLYDSLLHRKPWMPDDMSAFDTLRKEIWEQWKSVVERAPTLNIHVLVTNTSLSCVSTATQRNGSPR